MYLVDINVFLSNVCHCAAVLTRPVCFGGSSLPYGPVTVTPEFGSVPLGRPEDLFGHFNSSTTFFLQTANIEDEATPHWPAGGPAAYLPPAWPAQPAVVKAELGDRSLWRTPCWGDSASPSPSLLENSWDGFSCLHYSAVCTHLNQSGASWRFLVLFVFVSLPWALLPPSIITHRYQLHVLMTKLLFFSSS